MKFHEMPKTYLELVALEAPRVIADRKHFDRVYKIITAMSGHEMTQDQVDYLETLCELVGVWEDKTCEIG